MGKIEFLPKGGRVLRELRLRNGLSQSDLAAKIGWDKTRISKLETGKLDLTLNAIERIAPALGEHPAVFALACLENEFPELSKTKQGKALDTVLRAVRALKQ